MNIEIAKNRYSSLIGRRFDKIVIREIVGHIDGKQGACALCECDCGRTANLPIVPIKQGQIHSCGMCGYNAQRVRETHMVDMRGKSFGKLTAIELIGHVKGYYGLVWKCKCACGRECLATQNMLQSGNKQSCGKCGYSLELLRKRCCKYFTEDEQRLAHVFSAMYGRCYNPNDQRFYCYGARGIYICNEWLHNVPAFVKWSLSNGYKRGLTIDRIDVNGPYSPDNCRWIPLKEQASNKTSNINIKVKGFTNNLAEWARITNMNYHTLCSIYYRHGIDRLVQTIENKLLGDK